MKVVILGTAYPFRGGLSAFNERMAVQFAAEGHEVEIVTFTLQYPSFLFPGKTQYSTGEAPKGLKITRMMNSVNPFSWIKTGRRISKMRADLLIIKFWLPFMSPCLGTIARIVRRNKHTKVVSILDNIIPHEKRFADKMFASYFVKSVDGFVAMSKSVLSDVELFDKKKPKIFSPHPLYDNFGDAVDRATSLKFLHLDENFKYVLFFGFIRDYKGLDLLMQAFADSRIKNSSMKLLVAGEFYNNSEKYFELEKELGLKGHIIWANDFVPDENVKYYFGASDIVVQPYKSATQSGVTQIAYNFDKPMIVTNVGGLSEIVPNGKVGYVVESEPKDIADAITKFFDNKESLTAEFVNNIALEKPKFSWHAMIDNIIKTSNHDNQK